MVQDKEKIAKGQILRGITLLFNLMFISYFKSLREDYNIVMPLSTTSEILNVAACFIQLTEFL